MNPIAAGGCFVTGTDTGVGKTQVSAALLHCLARAGLQVAGFKPVAAGTTPEDRGNEDVRALRAAGTLQLSDAEVGPFQFDMPCAPQIAAALEGRTIDRERLLDAARSVQQRVDFIVVEGVGGFCVPLGAGWDTADLAEDLGLPVVIVVGLRLGCLNHALLTGEAVRARGLRIAGWIGSAIHRDMLLREPNVASLRDEFARRHEAPCLGIVPWLEAPTAAGVAAHLDEASLLAALGAPERSSMASAAP